MKKHILLAGVTVALGALTGCLDSDSTPGQAKGSSSYKGPLLRYHYAGRAALGKNGTATVLKAVEGMPETAATRGHFAQKLAAAATDIWKDELPADATAQPELLRPIIEDLTTAESLIEIQGPMGKTETLIAAQLTDERARLWNTNLAQLARAWKLGTPAAVTVDGVAGWSVRRAAGGTLQHFRSGQWTIVHLGSDRPPTLSTSLQAAVKSGRPLAASTNLLELQADLPGLKKWVPLFGQFPLPPIQLKMVGRGEDVRTEMRLMYARPIPWKFEPWQIPTNVISDPLMSFTVGQGTRAFFEKFPNISAAGLSIPNQFCAWGVYHDYNHTFFAAPQPGFSNKLAQLVPSMPDLIKPYFDTPIGKFTYAPNRGELVWAGGMPGVTPTLEPIISGGQEFMYFRLFPLTVRRVPPPSELFAQLEGRTNLLYYDWELSSNRVVQARQLYQLASMFDLHPPITREAPSQKWLDAVAPKLGNAVTEVTMVSPQELSFVRKSQLGLTGFELATISAWLESPAFPDRIERPRVFKVVPPKAGAGTGTGTARPGTPPKTK
jgi:hypothetical protein